MQSGRALPPGAPSRERFARSILSQAILLACVSAGLGAASPAAFAQAAAAQTARPVARYDIPAGTLDQVLNRYAAQAGILLAIDGTLTAGKTSAGLSGDYGLQDGFRAILANSGLEAVAQSTGGYALRKAAEPSVNPAIAAAQPEAMLPTVRVTASSESPGDLPKPYAGRQVARGGRVGLLGNKDVMDTPFNQTTYTSEFIQNQSASTVGDTLDSEPSLRHVAGSSGGYDGYFSIRGFNVLSSDVSINGLYGMVPWFGGIPTDFVERVEVLKGASALLSGMSPNAALGGAINLVPKRATDQPIARATVGLDSDSLWAVQADVGRRFGADNEWGLRVNVSDKDGDTYIDGQSRRRPFGSLALDYQGERLRLALDAYSFRESNRGGDISGVSMAGRTSVIKAPSGATNFASGLKWDSETNAVMLGGEYDINKAVTAYAKVGVGDYKRDGFSTNAVRNVQDNGDATLLVINNAVRRHSVSWDAGIRSRFQTGPVGHDVTLSASRYAADISNAAYNSVNVATNIYDPVPIPAWPVVPTAIPKTSDVTRSGIAIADTLAIADGRVQLTPGIRHQGVGSNSYAASGAVTAHYNKSAWTPMVGLVVKPTDHLSLYANYIEGLSQGIEVGTTYLNAGEVFPPYKTKQVEIGAKLETGTIINTLSLFQIKKPSTLTDNSTSPLPTLRLDGEQRNRGVEWSVFGEVVQGVRVLGGATYMQGRLTKTQGGLYDGHEAPGSAPWAFNIGGEWDPHWVPGLTLTSRLIYTSAQYADNANTLKLPAWTRVDVGARFSTEISRKAVVFRAGITNLLNKNYYQGIQFESNSVVGAPRNFQISASMDF